MIEIPQETKDILRQELMEEDRADALREDKMWTDEAYCIEQYEDIIIEAHVMLNNIADRINQYGYCVSPKSLMENM